MAPLRFGLILLGALGGAARAAPVAVRVVGAPECPSAAQLEAALRALPGLLAGASGGWTVALERRAGASRMWLTAPDGVRALEREVSSDDCAALADAFALIVRGRFEELQAIGPAPKRHRPGLVALGLSGGAALSAGPLAATGGGQLAVAVRIYDRRAALLVRLAAAIDGPSRQGAADPVDLLPSFVRLGVAVRLERGRLWLQPGLGAGALLLRVSAPSAIGAPTEIRALAALYADAVFAVRLWQGLSLCVELSLTGLPAIERYVVRPDGAQATSPYLRAAAQLGLQVDL